MPGFVLVGLYVVYLILVAIFKSDWAPAMPEEELAQFHGRAMVKRVFQAFVLPAVLVVAVLGSIFAGIASPTEAAAVGAFGATLLTVFQKKFSYATLKSVMVETTHLTCMVFIILVGATAFGLVFRGMHGDAYLTNLILSANMSPGAFLAPIFVALGVDLLWLGILIAMNLQTSFLTPPFGFSLFYLKGVAPPEVRTGHIYRGIIPFIIIQLIGLTLVITFPEMATSLPKYLGG